MYLIYTLYISVVLNKLNWFDKHLSQGHSSCFLKICMVFQPPKQTITCLKSTTEILGKGVKYAER